MSKQFIFISSARQMMDCFSQNKLWKTFPISTAKNGLGEQNGSGCTPRGWHRIYSRIGIDAKENSVFVTRQWTGEIYSSSLARQFPQRDWILTRILQIDGVELGRNKGGEVDSLKRFIYIHGTPDSTPLGKPGSKGCIRINNKNVIELSDWVKINTLVYIE